MRKLTGHINSSTLLALLCTGLLAFAGCGSPPPGGGGGNGNGNGGNGNQTNNETGNNDPSDNTSTDDESTFDAEAEGDVEWTGGGSVDSEDVDHDEDDEEAVFGAAIIDNVLHVTLISDDGSFVDAEIHTSEDETIPGEFQVQGFGAGGTFVVVDDPATGDFFFESASDNDGTISLTTCPEAELDMARGSFNDVELVNPMTGGEIELSGSFDVAVAVAMNPSLHCEEPSGNNDPTNNDPSNNDPQQCDWEMCEPEGECCPYADCMFGCEETCYFEDPDCGGGMNPEACAQCVEDCYDNECGVSDACLNAVEDLNQCEIDHNCDEQEDAQQCSEENCCAELKTVL